MTETLVGVVVGGLLAFFVHFGLDTIGRWKDEEERKRRRDEALKCALRYILVELEDTKITLTVKYVESERYWPPILDSGLDHLRGIGLFDRMSSELQSRLLTTYGDVCRIDHYVRSEGPKESKQGGFGRQAIKPLRDQCLKAIEECVPAVKNLLAEMEPTDRKSV